MSAAHSASSEFLTDNEANHLGRGGEKVAYADLTEDEAARLFAYHGCDAGSTGERPSFVLPAEVWDFSGTLRHIKEAALARQVSPDAVLHAMLAILASLLNHGSRVFTGKGFSVLSYFTIVVGPSGSGKTEALSCARALLKEWIDERFAIIGGRGYVEQTLGSGEGLIEAFMGDARVPKLDDAGNKLATPDGQPIMTTVRQQIRHNALFHTDEGRALLQLDARNGATVMSVICEMWSGSVAGQTNADPNRTRKIAAGSYVVGLLLGFQPETIKDLFADTAGGAPQRFAFASATHPDITADEIEWPGDLLPEVAVESISVTLPRHLRQRVREYQASRARGELDESPLDGHKMLLTCRTATLLALLHGTEEVNDEHWGLAEKLVSISCQLRDHLVAQLERDVAETARKREEAAVRTQVTAATRVADAARIRRAADAVVRAVEAKGELTYGRAKHALKSNLRDVADAAISLTLADGRLVAEDRTSSSGGGRRQVTILRVPTEDGEDR